ncbi:hypothetical protein WN51_04378 [Melipona quadrifasciata]|uniref:Uncharacterized protein n=1 Tax=Melipona quadrifasciata TaxID=166423 RepID=A0A0M8ZQZ4_9HYME|nr:hypothetical protein WN51_04378 [Melipona quadrifasciata]
MDESSFRGVPIRSANARRMKDVERVVCANKTRAVRTFTMFRLDTIRGASVWSVVVQRRVEGREEALPLWYAQLRWPLWEPYPMSWERFYQLEHDGPGRGLAGIQAGVKGARRRERKTPEKNSQKSSCHIQSLKFFAKVAFIPNNKCDIIEEFNHSLKSCENVHASYRDIYYEINTRNVEDGRTETSNTKEQLIEQECRTSRARLSSTSVPHPIPIQVPPNPHSHNPLFNIFRIHTQHKSFQRQPQISSVGFCVILLVPKYPPNTPNRERQGAISPCGNIHRKNTGRYGVFVYKNKSSGFLVQASKQSHLASAPKEQGECFLRSIGGWKDRATGIQDPGKPYYPAGSLVFHAQITQAREKIAANFFEEPRMQQQQQHQPVPVSLRKIFSKDEAFEKNVKIANTMADHKMDFRTI